MRTTLDLEKPLLEKLKDLQKKEKRPLGKIASTLLTEALAVREAAGESASAVAWEWHSAEMKARVDLADKDALYRALEER